MTFDEMTFEEMQGYTEAVIRHRASELPVYVDGVNVCTAKVLPGTRFTGGFSTIRIRGSDLSVLIPLIEKSRRYEVTYATGDGKNTSYTFTGIVYDVQLIENDVWKASISTQDVVEVNKEEVEYTYMGERLSFTYETR